MTSKKSKKANKPTLSQPTQSNPQTDTEDSSVLITVSFTYFSNPGTFL
jgi:hypothetical protein